MLLDFGLDTHGHYVHVGGVGKGKVELFCPYCNGQLQAKKGKVIAHHFAHLKDTCQKSKLSVSITQIPTIDRFELLTPLQQKYITKRKSYTHENIYSFKGMDQAVAELSAMGVIEVNRTESSKLKSFRGLLAEVDGDLLTDGGKPTDQLLALNKAFRALGIGSYDLEEAISKQVNTATRFAQEYHRSDLSRQSTLLSLMGAQSFWLNAHYRYVSLFQPEFKSMLDARYKRIASQHLYLFLIDDMLKIGMTTGEPEKRLAEVCNELGGVSDAMVVSFVPYAGRVERLAHELFSRNRIEVGNHREYFDRKLLPRLIDQFDELALSEPKAYEPPVG